MHAPKWLFMLLLAIPMAEAQTYLPANSSEFNTVQQAQPLRHRAQIEYDIRNAERTIFEMKRMMDTERFRAHPNMDVIQACAIEIAKAEEYLRRLHHEYAMTPY